MSARPGSIREQRARLRETLAALQRPEAALELVRPCLDLPILADTATCTLRSVRPNRFVLEVRVRAITGAPLGYAVKAYSDDFGTWVWQFGQAIAALDGRRPHHLCLPIQYVAARRALVFPWIDGTSLSQVADHLRPALLERAARLAAEFHRMPAMPAPPLTAEEATAEAVDRCRRLRYLRPTLAAELDRLSAFLQEASTRLDPVHPAMIHADLAPSQFVWTGDHLVLLDLDATRVGDPAFDVGHFLGQLDRRCTLDTSLPAEAATWPARFRDAYLAAAGDVSLRNVSFYQGLTLVRKMYTLCRRDPVAGPSLAVRLAERAWAAFEPLHLERCLP